jgi:aspartyl-tRNA(Asn)/glutamyl-tRNA(Gln) amidotransferase subunit A
MMPFTPSLDHAGPIGRCVRDLAVTLSVVAGHDSRDSASAAVAVDDYVRDLDVGIAGLTIGVLTGHFRASIDPGVGAAVDATVDVLEAEGATTRELELPLAEHASAVLFALCLREGADAHAQVLRERPDAIGDDVRLYLELGAVRPPAERERALRVRARMREAWRDAFAGFDAAIAPTLPATAALAGQETLVLPDGPEPVVAAYLRLCAPASVVGLPALSLPCGFDNSGLPIGLQVIGRPFEEATLLRIGNAYERSTEWHRRRPAVAGERGPPPLSR